MSAVKLRSLLRPAAGPADSPVQRAPARPSLDDSQLRNALRDGDVAAANAACRRLAPRVRGTVRRLLGPADPDGDDVVQKSLFEIVSTIESYRGESSFETWASAIAARVVYKHIRRRRLERRVFSPATDDSEPLQANNVVVVHFARQLEARHELSTVFALLASLDEEKIFPFLLHDVCGFDLREIAEIVGVTVAAAQSRLVRGRLLVHETLSKQEASPLREENP